MSADPENPLEEALVRAKKNPMSRREFYSVLLESDLVVVGRIEGREFSDLGGALRPDEKLQLGRVEYKGRAASPASPRRRGSWPESIGPPHMSCSTRARCSR